MADTPARIPEGESYIGKSVVRPQAARLLGGRGVFTDDLRLPRMLHVAFLRSPHAHARIVSLDARAALAIPGVVRVVTGEELAG
ncbi:MAG TPA: xanthine dehydrogenase family protein molybdopterin-binding subunit, partial [Methylomirabilota bacterium]|nr:xanthine dehydrogenase family protein molybdopterin-binding subunit [Methylomirabilota bacterium]